MYDFVVVGAGISSAAFCARLKHKYKILVLETRDHIGGNCYDYKASGSFVHKYGPHIFHTPNKEIVEFLSNFTKWNQYVHSVTAEIDNGKELKRVPFPYSRLTEKVLGKVLTPDEVINHFFKPYSKKMWGMDFDDLPASIKGRVPKDTADAPAYFPNQFVGSPKDGFTRMIEKMFDGVDILLGAYDTQWIHIPCEKVIYCGRLDHLNLSAESRAKVYGSYVGWLPYRSLDIQFKVEDWDDDAPVVNFCHNLGKYTRKTSYAKLTGGNSRIVSYEIPHEAKFTDMTPFYPIPMQQNLETYKRLKEAVELEYPNLIPLGRLANYKYIDMDAAVAYGLKCAKAFE